MAQSTKKKSTSKKSGTKAKTDSGKAQNAAPPPPPEQPRRREIAAVVFLFLAVFVLISYFTQDGSFIRFFSDLAKGLTGWGFWIIAPVFLLIAVILGFHRGRPITLRLTSALLLPILFAAIANLMFYGELPEGEVDLAQLVGQLFEQGQNMRSGGILGGALAIGLERAFSRFGAYPVLIAAFLFCVFSSFNFSISGAFGKLEKRAETLYDPQMYDQQPVTEKIKNAAAAANVKRTARSYPIDIPLGDDEEALPFRRFEEPKSAAAESAVNRTKVRRHVPKIETFGEDELSSVDKKTAVDVGSGFTEYKMKDSTKSEPVALSAEISDPPKKISRAELEAESKAVEAEISEQSEPQDYIYPPLELLRGGSSVTGDCRDEIAVNRDRLEGAIKSFGINAGIVGVIRGPTVTRYDIELEQGVKLSRVTNLAGDLALALGVVNVRIAPIPDKISTVGIEVPNKIVSTVYLRDILESTKFTGAKSKLSFALGKDIGGDCVVGNIAKLPHMLIAGTTGSGKSVCMNSLILSLLYKARPDEVRLIMIDPKMVELGAYNGIPHLYVPVVTDPKKAAGALQWSVVEMLKRYRLFSEAGVRDLESYNRIVEQNGEPRLPQIVIVIDELADLMMAASKEVEESICRVAQMGRAAGMHLVIATQRPSADVITGLMKANIPSRIAFAVSSAMESRIILDQAGAEKLVGMGDMLYAPVGCGKPTRIQGAFVSDDERENVIQFIKENASQSKQNDELIDYINTAGKKDEENAKSKDEDDPAGNYDEMLPQAVEAVLEAKSCSVSMLQRRVKLGYSRAARIVDQMEELGIVGPYEGAKPRAVITDRDGWHDIQVQLGLIPDDMALAAEMNEDLE